MSTKNQLLGDFTFAYDSFENLDDHFKQFTTDRFQNLSSRKKFKEINSLLLQLIQNAPKESFLLPATLEFIAKVNQEKLLQEPYKMSSFEFWLNRFSLLSDDENLRVRAKLSGKYIPRSCYQELFPIGMAKTYPGSHFIAAHASPDIDTTIASFLGWIDAFSAKVADGVHHWSLPGTFPDCHFTMLFSELFSPKVFEYVARTTPTLTLSALDLVTQKNMLKIEESAHFSEIEHANDMQQVVIIDKEGHYKGDWRSQDTESVGNIMMLFNNVVRAFENAIHSTLVATFAKPAITKSDVEKALLPLLSQEIKSLAITKSFSDAQKAHLNTYLELVLHVKKGLHATFQDLGNTLDIHVEHAFNAFFTSLSSLSDSSLYDATGKLREDRPNIFSHLETIIQNLTHALQKMRAYVERLDVMLQVKEKVLLHPPLFVTLQSDVDEMRSKINGLDHLTVCLPENHNSWFPVGVISAYDLRKPILGTVSLRDFSNEKETQMASYLEVISVVDHHKTELKTQAAPCFVVADVQSSNTLVAELAFELNDRFSTRGQTIQDVDFELKELAEHVHKSPGKEKLSRLATLSTLKANLNEANGFFVHPKREYAEYLCCLYAILDDTDLLTKVSDRDVLCVAKLLNRMKSLVEKKHVEIIRLDHIPQDAKFAKNAAKEILKNPEMYSIYKKIYEYKEQEMEQNLADCINHKPSTVFADTKEQNGCARVGQTKIFCSNFPFFAQHETALRTLFFNSAKKVYEAKNHIDFHMHMISTIAGAEEVYSSNLGNWKHQDEMWIWVPPTELGVERLTNFLNAFLPTESAQKNSWTVEFLGPNAFELHTLFERHFPIAKRISFGDKAPSGLPIAVLRYNAGSLNSRKAQITPYLPRLVP